MTNQDTTKIMQAIWKLRDALDLLAMIEGTDNIQHDINDAQQKLHRIVDMVVL